jgi:hypothetical protein
MIGSPKTTLTLVWNPHGFQAVQALPRGCQWTSQYEIGNILPEICALHFAGDRRRLVLHADDPVPHVSTRVKPHLEDISLRTALHPSYSPDRAPSNFFLAVMERGRPRIGVSKCGRAFGSGSSDVECDSNPHIDWHISRVNQEDPGIY